MLPLAATKGKKPRLEDTEVGGHPAQEVQVLEGRVLATAKIAHSADLPSSARVLHQTIPNEVAIDFSSLRPLESLERGTLVVVSIESP